jgi:hypothetical protein
MNTNFTNMVAFIITANLQRCHSLMFLYGWLNGATIIAWMHIIYTLMQ